jgi:hypothetical protein
LKFNYCRFETKPSAQNTVNTKLLLQITAIALLSTINHQRSTCVAQGSLTPPGAPAPTMKTLAQIEPRTPVVTAPFTISVPGSYYLTTNVSVNVSNAITIAVSDVTLDLNGFTISSTTPSPAGSAIRMGNALTNITIFNGFIASGVKEAGGIYSGHGFNSGIDFVLDLSNPGTLGAPFNVLVSHVSVSGCLSYGIFIGATPTIVDSCVVQTVGSYGIFASTIRNSVAMDCGGAAIEGFLVSDCQGQCSGSDYGIYAGYTAQNCYGSSTNGYGLSATTAQNCEGSSTGSDGIFAQQAVNCQGSSSASAFYGIYADVAENCYGNNTAGVGLRAASSAINCHAQGGTTGLEADGSAENCYGRANTNGIGLLAGSASNCYGYCPAGNSGTGLSAGQALNCFGQDDENGVGLYASSAIGCQGRCYGNNFGISATILNSCTYYRQIGTPGYNGAKYNMP